MKRIVNPRVPVLLACAIAAGVGAGYAFSYYNADIFWIIAVIPLTALLSVILLLLRKPKILFITASVIVVFTGAFFNCYERIENYKICNTDTSEVHYIKGKVSDKGSTDSGEYVVLSGATADGEKLDGKIYAYLSAAYGDFCDIGYSVEFEAKLSSYDAFPYGKLNYNAEKNVKYSCSVQGGLKAEYGFSLFGSIRSHIRETLYDNLDGDTAAICYAMLLGDTQNIDDQALQSFRFGGIAHIFAVSGLHIGLVFAIIKFLCKKLRFNKFLTAALCGATILFYAGVCGFTLSSVRAVIMCAVTLITGLIHVKKDGLNSLAFAVIIILSVTPLSLFSVGFQLSVCAVGGIFVCSGFFNKLFAKTKIPAKITGAVGTSLGAQLGTFPVMLAKFGYVSGAGIILNPVILPVISVLYMLVFISTLLCAIIPPIGILLYYAAIPLEGVTSFLIDAGFEKSLITGFGTGGFVPIYFICMLFLSDKINFRLFVRIIGLILSAAVLAAFVLLQTYSPFNGFSVCVSAYYNGGNVIFKSPQGTVLVITENVSVTQTVSSLNEDYARNPDAVIILGGDGCAMSYDPELGCKNVYISNLYIPVQPYENVEFHYEEEFELCGISFYFTDGYTLLCDLDGATVAVCAGSVDAVGSCDLLISKNLNYDEKTHLPLCDAGTTVYFNEKGYRYNCYEYGSMKFRFN